MKKTSIIALVLFAVIFLVGCKEISQLKKMCVEIEENYRGIGVYDAGKLIMFISNEKTNSVYFNVWNPTDKSDKTWFVEKKKGQLGGTEYSFKDSQFVAKEWSEESGIMGWNSPFPSFREINRKEFLEAVRPFAKILLEKGTDIITAQRPLAEELGLIPGSKKSEC